MSGTFRQAHNTKPRLLLSCKWFLFATISVSWSTSPMILLKGLQIYYCRSSLGYK